MSKKMMTIDEVADREEARKWEELPACRLCGRRPQVLILKNSVKVACPNGCKIIEAPNLTDAAYVWGEKWHSPPPQRHD